MNCGFFLLLFGSNFIYGRGIDGIKCVAVGDQFVTYTTGDKLPQGYTPISDQLPLIENYIDLGFVRNCSLGLKSSQFTDLIYDKNRYDVILAEAKADLEEKEKKYQKLGTFNLEVSQAQERLYALNLKMGIIEVGADTELSQKLLKDAVDDAVKAAASAFNHGVVLGCNVNLIQVLNELLDDDDVDDLTFDLTKILLEGFKDVYKTVLTNAFDDVIFAGTSAGETISMIKEYFDDKIMESDLVFKDEHLLAVAVNTLYHRNKEVSIHDVIVEYSIISNQVFDVSQFVYSDYVINSSQTDEEILKATIDLISLLIVGNQMVITQKHNFAD